jgi:regulator of sigma D
MDRMILDYVAATHFAVETQIYAKYKDFDVVELIQENFTLYGQLVLLNQLKPTGFIFNYKRKAFKYYLEMQ